MEVSKLQKKLKDEKLYFIVKNINTDNYNDWFIFKNHTELSKLERYFFDLMKKQFDFLFEDEDYSSQKYRIALLILYNICTDGDVINVKNTDLLNQLYLKIRYVDFVNKIDFFKFKLTPEGVELYKNHLLSELKYDDLSPATQKIFAKVLETTGYIEYRDDVFKEILTICINTEYEKALEKSLKLSKMMVELENEQD